MKRCGATALALVVYFPVAAARAQSTEPAPPAVAPVWLRQAIGNAPQRPAVNRPPEWPAELRNRAVLKPERTLVGRVGALIEFDLAATDPDGDPVRYAALDLPAGARFDADGHFSWRPLPSDEGRHRVRFSASDGRDTTRLTVEIHVGVNQTPVRDDEMGSSPSIVVGHAHWRRLARDPEGEPLSFELKKALVGLEFQPRGGELWFLYQPRPEDIGAQEFVVTVSDGETATEIRQELYVYTAEQSSDWLFHFAPGLGYAAYVPFQNGISYQGFRAELSFVGRRKAEDEARRCEESPGASACAPSHLRFYAAIETTYATRDGVDPLLAYGIGYTRSFEFNPGRGFLIPHYALELGMLSSRSLPELFALMPALGLHLFAKRPIWLDVTAGVRVVPSRLDELLGFHTGLELTVDAL
jgi:hypothetical protein